MKILMYAVLEPEKKYIKEWSEKTGVEVKCVDERLNKETVEWAKGFDGIDFQQTQPLDPEVYQKLHEYGIKQLTARMVGYDMIDFDLAKKYDLIVTNVPAYSPRAIAEMGLTQALRLVRKLGYYDQRMDNLDFRWAGLESTEIYNLTVGIIGAGHIGGASAQLYSALGAKVIATDPIHRVELNPYLEYTDQDTLLKTADIVTVHTPLDKTTENLFNSDTFKKMKPTAYLINMARGGIVNANDLIDALKNKEIAGAALDTLADEGQFFEKQATPDEIPEDYKTLRAMPNVLISPHSAFYTDTAMKNMVAMGLDDVVAIVNGKRPQFEVFN
ncbi:D-2-hydroxyacid dehydrogenase [Limosilactobacillus viscerum]|uniref:D-2-hydroxyacid dehydrogenase n=1 Tax=Limosilactobacillus viscerum TaxID=2993450 RepID=UPI0024BBB9FD|nr:D-2-hydroxyacid dehydrogenase [Limosilactobacillus viscerum]